MNKLTTFVFLLLISSITFGQQSNPAPSLTKQDYLKKSKNQRTAAWIIGGCGVVITAVGVGIAVADAGEEFFGVFVEEVNDGGGGGGIIALTGLAAIGTSIILFLASDKNKKRAASLSFSNQLVPQMNNGILVNKPVPSLSLKIGL